MEDVRVLEGDQSIASLAEAGLSLRGKIVRGMLVVLGTLSVALGVIGAVVPVLPTTPFLLLAAACYLRSSRRLHRWLLSNRVFGEYIRRYLSGEGLSLATKVVTLILLWLSLGASAFLAVPERLWWVRLLLFIVGIGVTTHLLRMKTSRR
jgi:uncharacterized protein